VNTVSSADSKNCLLVLKHINPVLVSIASKRSDGYIEAHAISTGSVALIVKAVTFQKSGSSIVPGLEDITFSPAKKVNLLRKNTTLFIV